MSCERRMHQGFIFVKNYLSDLINRYRVPISYINIQFGGGVWLMPDEFNRKNHPYKYGYGTIFHSGYHYLPDSGIF
jgi:hypothetical protein